LHLLALTEGQPVARTGKRSLAVIEAEIEKLKREADSIRASEIAEVVSKIKAAIAAYGLTATDLGLAPKAGRKPGPGKARRTMAKRGRGKGVKAAGGARPVKYRDADGNSWVGFGKRPAWFVAALAAGKTPADLLVKPAA
jgi:DNA-binding protein H-NS